MTRTTRNLAAPALAGALIAVALTGCFDEPEIEDRWTRVDIASANVSTATPLQASASVPITVGVDVTYRAIVTGFAVAELRASSTLAPAGVAIGEDRPRLTMAQDIDRILANSTSLGRATRAVTGWDHLIQHIDFTFTGNTPAAGDSTARGLFLLCYLGAGEEMEVQGGNDSLVVTPFGSEAYQILPVGMALGVTP